ncbi:hypothetical protein SSAG_05089 [Streptomyces sp. Mg1]|nr:hypothetical protein SSAG_05089 [Streptomyces sp. Mg1]
MGSSPASESGAGYRRGAQYAMHVAAPMSAPKRAVSHWDLSRSSRTLFPLPCTYTTLASLASMAPPVP